MRIKFKPLTEAKRDKSRWKFHAVPLPGVWYSRRLPRLPDGSTIKFAADFAARHQQQIALALEERWVFWFDSTLKLKTVTPPASPEPTPPCMRWTTTRRLLCS